MIYLIGGAPRVGKSTIAKQFAKSINERCISTDELEDPDQSSSVIFYSDPKKNIVTPNKGIESVNNEAKQIISKIKNIIDNAVNKNQDTIIEGVNLFPAYVDDFIKKFGEENIKAVFIGSRNIELILEGMARNTSEKNWLKDFNQEVLKQIALFTKAFSNYIYLDADKYKLLYMERSNDFQQDILDVIKELS